MKARLDEISSVVDQLLRDFPYGAALGLVGDLGAGKTALVRAVIEQIAKKCQIKKPRVSSPSFVYHQSYPELIPRVEHFDLYRLDHATEDALLSIGYFDALDLVRKMRGYLFVEWPERANREDLQLDRLITIRISGEGREYSWQERSLR